MLSKVNETVQQVCFPWVRKSSCIMSEYSCEFQVWAGVTVGGRTGVGPALTWAGVTVGGRTGIGPALMWGWSSEKMNKHFRVTCKKVLRDSLHFQEKLSRLKFSATTPPSPTPIT